LATSASAKNGHPHQCLTWPRRKTRPFSVTVLIQARTDHHREVPAWEIGMVPRTTLCYMRPFEMLI